MFVGLLLAVAVAIAYFSHAVTAQQAVFVYISFHAIDASFLGVLPGKDVSSVAQLGHMSIVLGYPKQVAVYSSLQIVVIETGVGVHNGLASVGAFHQHEKLL